ncbi:MAG: GyrI-like domain-containing protein [Bacillaceae bacterium]|nr:GyrI-like domain-containing protein [Bacillaceae bacterium]
MPKQRIFSEWFPATGYEHADAPELEVYYSGNPNDENYRSEVWTPIKNKTKHPEQVIGLFCFFM